MLRFWHELKLRPTFQRAAQAGNATLYVGDGGSVVILGRKGNCGDRPLLALFFTLYPADSRR